MWLEHLRAPFSDNQKVLNPQTAKETTELCTAIHLGGLRDSAPLQSQCTTIIMFDTVKC